MQTKNQVSFTRKTLNVIMLLGLFFSTFGTGNLPSARAQEAKIDVPNIAPKIQDLQTSPNDPFENFILYYSNNQFLAQSLNGSKIIVVDSINEAFFAENTLDVFDIQNTPLPSSLQEDYGFYHGVWSENRQMLAYLAIQPGNTGFRIDLFNNGSIETLYRGILSERIGYLEPISWLDQDNILLLERYILDGIDSLRIYKLSLATHQIDLIFSAAIPGITGKSLQFSDKKIFLGADVSRDSIYYFDILTSSVIEITMPLVSNYDGLTDNAVLFHPIAVITRAVLDKAIADVNANSVSNKNARPSPFLYWPLNDNLRSTLNYPNSPWQTALGLHTYSSHQGTDLLLGIGNSVYAAADGYVVETYNGCPDLPAATNNFDGHVVNCTVGAYPFNSGLGYHRAGNAIMMGHNITISGNARTWYSFYAHLKQNSQNVVKGQSNINRGSKIAETGHSGISSDPHFHFEIRNASGYTDWDDPWGSADAPHTNPDDGTVWVYQNGKIVAANSGGGSTNRPPNTPTLSSPGDWNESNTGQAPTLCWNNNGDPDGNSVQFYAEVYGSAANASSGWTSSTCWRPSSLDGQYYTYQWHVKAKDSNGAESNWSDTWHFTMRQPVTNRPPNTPTLSSPGDWNESSTGLAPTLCWNNNGDPDGDSVQFYAEVYQSAANANSGWTASTCWRPSSLDSQYNTYNWRVKARDSKGVESDWSGTWHFTMRLPGPSIPMLSSPADGTTVGRYDSVTVSWNTASNATQYYAEFWGDSGLSLNSGWTSGTSWFIGSNFWGGTYQWHVKARNGSGTETGWSETRILKRTYGNPSSLSATAVSQNQINLSWSSSADAPGNIDGYRIYRDGTSILTVNSSTTTFGDTTISCGSSYTYVVKAYRGSLESNASNSASASAINCPPVMPGNLTVVSATQSSLTLNWQDNSNNETGFKIYRWGYDGTQWTFIYLTTVGSNITSYTQTGLDCGSDFNYYEVSAYNANGESTHAGWVQGTTAACPASDLVITNISFDPTSPFTNDDVWAYVDITNVSNIDAPGFWTDFYVDATPAGCSDWGSYYGWVNGLAANETFTWRTRIPANSLTTGAHQFRAFVDSGCVVTESNESNNILSATFTLTLPSLAAPTHDDFDSARLVSPISYSDTLDVSGATTASDDPYVPDCGGYALMPGMTSVWYQYTPSANESLYLDTFGSSYDTYIAVWSGTRGNLSSVACNDDLSGHGLQSGLTVSLTAGTTYYFEVAQFSDSAPVSAAASAASMDPAQVVLPAGASSVLVAPQARRAPSAKASSLEATAEQQKVKSDVNAQAGGTLQFHATKAITLNTFNSASRWTSAFDLSHGWTVSQYMRTLGDVNGDGKADLIGFGLDGVYVALSTGSGFGSASRWTSAFDLSHGWTVKDFVRTVGDVNNDGRDDLIGFGLDGVYVALSNGTSFGAISRWTTSFDLSHGWTVRDFVRTVGDVNNDGRDDLIGFGLDGVYVALSNGTSFGAISRWTTSFDLSHGWTVKDFVRTVGDVNNDGRDDLIGFGLDGVYVALSNGTGFGPISRWTTSFDLSHGWTVADFVRTVGDVNGDGKADLIGFGLDGVYVALSNGVGFIPSSMGTTGFNYSTQGWRVDQHYRTLGDVNVDGKADLVGFGLDGVYVGTAK